MGKNNHFYQKHFLIVVIPKKYMFINDIKNHFFKYLNLLKIHKNILFIDLKNTKKLIKPF